MYAKVFSSSYMSYCYVLENDWHKKQDMQCAYNLILTSVLATTVRVEKQYVLHIVSVCL